MVSAATSLFPLPQTKVVESVVVQLTDGTIVTRTPDQLAALPAGELPPPAPATSTP
jgi:hypothetical protein